MGYFFDHVPSQHITSVGIGHPLAGRPPGVKRLAVAFHHDLAGRHYAVAVIMPGMEVDVVKASGVFQHLFEGNGSFFPSVVEVEGGGQFHNGVGELELTFFSEFYQPHCRNGFGNGTEPEKVVGRHLFF